jgi:homocysteine S-methyltransferase
MYAEPVRLMKDRVDLFILETMCSVDQADGALRAVARAGKPVWLAVSVMDDDGSRLRSGEPIGALAELVAERAPDAVLINCARPEAIAAGLEIVKVFGRPFGAYANGFSVISEGFLGDAPTVDALERRTDLTPEAYAHFAIGWVRQGATIVGGCCEVGPTHIAEIARRLRAEGHHIV